MHPVDTTQIRRFTAAGGAHDGDDMVAGDIDIYILDDMIASK
jgi:hypothetical protein